VIVVDAGSSDGTWELLNERRSEWPLLKLARVAGATPGRGRNEGIRRAESDVIATLDAGSRIGPNWLAALTGPLTESSEERVCIGVVQPDARSEFERAAGWLTLRAYKSRDRAALLGRAFLPAGRNGYCFRRRAWEAAGGYPPELRWGEDKLFLQRLCRAGFAIVVAPDAVVRWRPRQTLAELYRQYAGYGRGDAVARVDRQNELVTFALYTTGALLATVAALGSGKAAAVLVVSVLAYLAFFVAPARKELGLSPALAWIPLIRVTADIAKMQGFAAAFIGRLVRRA
jgi:cellulose synthase/poly-beta-1,6-N-acetylglucosamine synthase-like glycosyltransferase